MRGPGLRAKIDVRRLWHCPRCGYERNVPATEVSVRCHCGPDEPLMQLVEHVRVQRESARPLDLMVTFDDFEESGELSAPDEKPDSDTAPKSPPSAPPSTT